MADDARPGLSWARNYGLPTRAGRLNRWSGNRQPAGMPGAALGRAGRPRWRQFCRERGYNVVMTAAAKSSVDQIRRRFDNDVERFSNLEAGQSATTDAPLVLDLIA